MNRRREILAAAFLVTAALGGCISPGDRTGFTGDGDGTIPEVDGFAINLRWVPTAPDERWSHVETGLLWSLSFLGASLPRGSFAEAVTRHDPAVFTLDLSAVGFSDAAGSALTVVLQGLRDSDEYARHGAVDIGRFLMATLYSSRHYYAITGAEPSLSAFVESTGLDNPVTFVATNSTIFSGNRVLRFPARRDDRFAFLAEEGTGSVADGSFVTRVFEVLDLMPNGQLRFAVYDTSGNLKGGADRSQSRAGKPGKCLWCHEINFQPLFQQNDPVPGFLTAEAFGLVIDSTQRAATRYRASLDAEVDFDREHDHTYMERVVFGFMEPSLRRIALEWGMTEAEARERLSDLTTHVHELLPELGASYHRVEVDRRAPYASFRVPESALETSEYEPNLLTGN